MPDEDFNELAPLSVLDRQAERDRLQKRINDNNRLFGGALISELNKVKHLDKQQSEYESKENQLNIEAVRHLPEAQRFRELREAHIDRQIKYDESHKKAQDARLANVDSKQEAVQKYYDIDIAKFERQKEMSARLKDQRDKFWNSGFPFRYLLPFVGTFFCYIYLAATKPELIGIKSIKNIEREINKVMDAKNAALDRAGEEAKAAIAETLQGMAESDRELDMQFRADKMQARDDVRKEKIAEQNVRLTKDGVIKISKAESPIEFAKALMGVLNAKHSGMTDKNCKQGIVDALTKILRDVSGLQREFTIDIGKMTSVQRKAMADAVIKKVDELVANGEAIVDTNTIKEAIAGYIRTNNTSLHFTPNHIIKPVSKEAVLKKLTTMSGLLSDPASTDELNQQRFDTLKDIVLILCNKESHTEFLSALSGSEDARKNFAHVLSYDKMFSGYFKNKNIGNNKLRESFIEFLNNPLAAAVLNLKTTSADDGPKLMDEIRSYIKAIDETQPGIVGIEAARTAMAIKPTPPKLSEVAQAYLSEFVKGIEENDDAKIKTSIEQFNLFATAPGVIGEILTNNKVRDDFCDILDNDNVWNRLISDDGVNFRKELIEFLGNKDLQSAIAAKDDDLLEVVRDLLSEIKDKLPSTENIDKVLQWANKPDAALSAEMALNIARRSAEDALRKGDIDDIKKLAINSTTPEHFAHNVACLLAATYGPKLELVEDAAVISAADDKHTNEAFINALKPILEGVFADATSTKPSDQDKLVFSSDDETKDIGMRTKAIDLLLDWYNAETQSGVVQQSVGDFQRFLKEALVGDKGYGGEFQTVAQVRHETERKHETPREDALVAARKEAREEAERKAATDAETAKEVSDRAMAAQKTLLNTQDGRIDKLTSELTKAQAKFGTATSLATEDTETLTYNLAQKETELQGRVKELSDLQKEVNDLRAKVDVQTSDMTTQTLPQNQEQGGGSVATGRKRAGSLNSADPLTNLEEIQRLESAAKEKEKKATKIQSVFRGHQVRKGLSQEPQEQRQLTAKLTELAPLAMNLNNVDDDFMQRFEDLVAVPSGDGSKTVNPLLLNMLKREQRDVSGNVVPTDAQGAFVYLANNAAVCLALSKQERNNKQDLNDVIRNAYEKVPVLNVLAELLGNNNNDDAKKIAGFLEVFKKTVTGSSEQKAENVAADLRFINTILTTTDARMEALVLALSADPGKTNFQTAIENIANTPDLLADNQIQVQLTKLIENFNTPVMQQFFPDGSEIRAALVGVIGVLPAQAVLLRGAELSQRVGNMNDDEFDKIKEKLKNEGIKEPLYETKRSLSDYYVYGEDKVGKLIISQVLRFGDVLIGADAGAIAVPAVTPQTTKSPSATAVAGAVPRVGDALTKGNQTTTDPELLQSLTSAEQRANAQRDAAEHKEGGGPGNPQ